MNSSLNDSYESDVLRWRKIVVLILFQILIHGLFAQSPDINRANIWYFGNGAGLDFSAGSPVAITNGSIQSIESCSSICDLSGNLLFYTDGDTVWDRNHNPMPNGTGLLGNCMPNGPNNSATQGVIIVPQPKSENLYYVFTVDCAENLGQNGMNYSIVDLNLNNGLGDVSIKNQFLFSPSTEGMAAAANCSMDTIWVVGHEFGTDRFYSYCIASSGLNTTPVISSTGAVVNNYEWQMKFSPNGLKLYYYTEIFDFDLHNGVVYNPITIPINGYGSSFSSNSRYLYISSSGNLIVQFDISYSNSTDISNSMIVLYNGISNDEYWGMQLAGNSRIYIAANDSSYLTSIDYPDNYGLASQFNPYSTYLSGKTSNAGLPSFIENYFNSTVIESCAGEQLTIPNTFTPNGDGYNDTFTIEGLKNGDRVFIYNRWGVKIFEFTDLNNGWNGLNATGDKCSEGVYYYHIERSNSQILKGFIHIFY